MSRRRFGRWLPPAIWAGAIFVASSVPGSGLPKSAVFSHDKIIHALVFAVLGALCARAARRAWIGALVATAYGALDELHQRYAPGRFSDGNDLLADAVGALVGAVGAMVFMWVRRRRAENARQLT